MSVNRDHATWYHASLLLGIVGGEEVIAWADRVIAGSDSHDDALTEVSLTAPGDLSALRFALQPACDGTVSTIVAAALFDRVGRELASGDRSVTDTFGLLKQARQMLKLATELDDAIRELAVANYLAIHTPGGEAGVGVRLSEWLSQFSGGEARLFSERTSAA